MWVFVLAMLFGNGKKIIIQRIQMKRAVLGQRKDLIQGEHTGIHFGTEREEAKKEYVERNGLNQLL